MYPPALGSIRNRAMAWGALAAAVAVMASGASAQTVVTDRDLPQVSSPVRADATPRLNAAALNADHRVVLQTATGFGLFAAVRGTAVDATSPDRLINGPDGRLFDESAGLGWRRANVSAMVGYMRPSDARPAYEDESISYHHARGRFGIGLSLHY